MKYLLGQLERREYQPGWEAWCAPSFSDRLIDLRPLSAQAQKSKKDGYVLIATDRDPLPGEILLAGAINETLTAKALDAVKDHLEIPEALSVSTLPELTDRLLGIYSDPDVGILPPPLIPGRDGIIRVTLGEISFAYRCPTEGAQWNNILKVLQTDYRNVKESGGDTYRKMLSVWQSKYGIENHEVFIPQDLPKEKPLRPSTTLTDNFDVGDHADINGQASSQGWLWGKLAASGILTVIKTNTTTYAQAQSANQRGYYRAESNLSSTDHYVQAQVRTEEDGFTPALMARKDSSATLDYYELQLGSPSGNSLWLLKVVSGTGTVLSNPSTAVDAATFYTLRLNISGTTLQMFKNAAQVGSDVTDSAISSGLRCGLVVQGNSALTTTGGFEDFEASDGLAAFASDQYYRQMRSA